MYNVYYRCIKTVKAFGTIYFRKNKLYKNIKTTVNVPYKYKFISDTGIECYIKNEHIAHFELSLQSILKSL